MPLKHATETFFVFLLGVIIAVTGFFAALLPALPTGIIPWAVLFVLALLYPLFLSPIFRRDRADYYFRLLHWVPVAILLVWFLLQTATLYFPALSSVLVILTWGWTLPLVALGFVLITLFCLHVIRRREQRIALLLVALVPFTALALAFEFSEDDWNAQIASMLWNGGAWSQLLGTGSHLLTKVEPTTSGTGELANLAKSEDESEEAWRQRLRAIERRRERIEKRLEQGSSVSSEDESSSSSDEPDLAFVDMPDPEITGTGGELRDVDSKPNALPASGGGMAAMSILMIAGYTSTLHKRALARS